MKIQPINNNTNFKSRCALGVVSQAGDRRVCHWENLFKEASKSQTRFQEFNNAIKKFNHNDSADIVAIDSFITKDAENFYIAGYRSSADLKKDRKGIVPLYSINSKYIWLNRAKNNNGEIQQLTDGGEVVKTYPSKLDALMSVLKNLGDKNSEEYKQLLVSKR